MAEPGPMTFLGGGLLVLLGESIRLWAVGYAGSATRTRHVGAPSLITNGPYGRVRNPLYVGNFVLSLGLCIMAWAWMPYMLGVFLAAFGVQYGLIVSLEEESLRKTFGAQYEAYLTEVPRFLPRFSGYAAGEPATTIRSRPAQRDDGPFQSRSAVLCPPSPRGWYWG